MSQSVVAMSASVESQAAEQGGSLSIDTFLRAIKDEAKKWVREQVDTEEERDAIIQSVLVLADIYVAPRWPFGWPTIRSAIEAFADSALDSLPTLLASSPPRTDPNTSIA